ncbi:hypothetical protein LIA77_06589 [Sarocladium implicatum]|nr:hypothetical protein LIA77_06589 [Sarocladium implicatum]
MVAGIWRPVQVIDGMPQRITGCERCTSSKWGFRLLHIPVFSPQGDARQTQTGHGQVRVKVKVKAGSSRDGRQGNIRSNKPGFRNRRVREARPPLRDELLHKEKGKRGQSSILRKESEGLSLPVK